jgi:putative acetyltransferase
MKQIPAIRTCGRGSLPALEALYPQAFPNEQLLPVLRRLLAEVPGVLSLAATVDSTIVGHVLFTPCRTDEGDSACSLLAPLAVVPAWQKQGIGSSLVREGLQRLREAGVSQVFVLGDPAYYGRHGFKQESQVRPPYALPAEWATAWQSQALGSTSRTESGRLQLPPPWMEPALWLP